MNTSTAKVDFDSHDDDMALSPSSKRYITLDDGMDFRTIAKIMTAAGSKMNHATARNVLMSAMNHFVSNMAKELKLDTQNLDLEEMLKETMIHEAFADLLYLAHSTKKG